MSRLRKKIIITWIGHTIFAGLILSGNFVTGLVVEFSFDVYRRHTLPKLPPVPNRATPWLCFVLVMIALSLAPQLGLIDLDPAFQLPMLWVLYGATVAGAILLFVLDFQIFKEDAVWISSSDPLYEIIQEAIDSKEAGPESDAVTDSESES